VAGYAEGAPEVTTFEIRCRCGEMSPKFGSKESMRAWHADHKRDSCVARRSSRAAVVTELSELLAYSRTFEPIPMPEPADQRAALWGAPPTGGLSRGQAGRPGPRNARIVRSSDFRNVSFRNQ
jgi:hypothetical protein